MSLVKFLFLPFILFLAVSSNANPMPLGLELNNSTVHELEKKYKIITKIPNYWDGYNYSIDVRNLDLKNISNVLIISNNNGLIQAIILTVNQNKFDEFFNMLSEKYSLIEKNIPSTGDKEAKFIDEDCSIIITAPYQSFDMELIYITNEFYNKFTKKLEQEQQEQLEKRKELL